ncbi:hypothetical protein DLAC_11621 [Tieghemostelium lacteum]|uniref:DUF4460 domain-containing protein n=1 Tax=Tieghemostelium lacteum TaxID=361077 RepID=A0A151ZIR8_TIELA|nr:hypothetical protein DLAC_11621 [Tieghemostelium lacteum]|eukprot:KYQ93891.1 hypothetical protein DLAC_11621 [Tieghemostelium lacteum]
MNQLILRVVVNNSKTTIQNGPAIRGLNMSGSNMKQSTITAMKSNWINSTSTTTTSSTTEKSKLYLFNNSSSNSSISSYMTRYYSTQKTKNTTNAKFIKDTKKPLSIEEIKEFMKYTREKNPKPFISDVTKELDTLTGMGFNPATIKHGEMQYLKKNDPEVYNLLKKHIDMYLEREEQSELETVDNFGEDNEVDVDQEEKIDFAKEELSENHETISKANYSKEELEYLAENYPLESEFLDSLETEKKARLEMEAKKKEVNEQQLPYFHTAKQAEKSLRAHLNQFFIKVHPDLFFNNVDQRVQNQQSLTQLNNLLRSLEEYIKCSEDVTDQTKLDKIPNQFSLSFYAQVEEDGAVNFVTQDFNFSEPPKEILSSRTQLITYTTELRFAVYRQVFDLFQKSGITIPKSDKDSVNIPESSTSEVYDDPWEEYFVEDRNNLSLKKQFESFLEKYPVTGARLRSEFTPEHQALMDSFSDQRVFFYFGENIKGDVDVLRSLGHRDIAEEQLIHIKNNLMALEYKHWINLPIVITNQENVEKLRSALNPQGFVVLPRDFKPEESYDYIKNQVIPQTTKQFSELIDIATNNRQILEDATVNLELALGSSTVVVENLFSLNQRSMDRVRELFNTAMGEYGELKLPLLQFLDQVKADLWRELPKTKFDQNEFGDWKMNNIQTTPEERIKLISQKEDSYIESDRVVPIREDIAQRSKATLKKIDQLTNLKEDQRSKPLELVDKNQFNQIQSSPFLNYTMDAVSRLSKLINNPVKVPFYNRKSTDVNQKQSQSQQNKSSKVQQKQQVEDDDIDLFYKPNKVAINIDLQANVQPQFCSTFDLPFSTAKEAPTANNVQLDVNRLKSVEDILSRGTEKSENNSAKIIEQVLKESQEKDSLQLNQQEFEYVEQKLSDFEWTNINLIISDRYQFITTDNNNHGFCFIPNNFKEQELFLFLNSVQDSFEKIHGTHLINLEKAEFIHSNLAIRDIVQQLKDMYKLKSLKIDNINLPDPSVQLKFAMHLRNSLSTETKLLPCLPFIDLVIGTTQDIKLSEDGTSAQITLSSQELNTKIVFSTICDTLLEKSQHFKNILAPNTVLDDQDFNFLHESIQTN